MNLEKLGNYVKVIGGYAFKSEDFTESGNPVIRISDISNGSVQLEKAAKIETSKIGKGINYKIEKGDILIAMSGATTGKIGVVPNDIDCEIYQNQRVGNFKILNPKKLDKKYLRFILLSPSYQRNIQTTMAGAAQPNISSSQLESFEIPLPPLPEQKRIAEVLDARTHCAKNAVLRSINSTRCCNPFSLRCLAIRCGIRKVGRLGY